MLKELFAPTEPVAPNRAGSGSLEGTAQLTAVAAGLVSEMLDRLTANYEELEDLFVASKTDNSAMDKLLYEHSSLRETDVEFLKVLDDAVLDSMLKSQQSKRSRLKGKVMTQDNYRNMMTGAAAELLIRMATGNKKSAGRGRAGRLEFTEEELAAFAADQELLRKALRNVQSKKSIMRAREDFSEDDPRWQALLVQEEQLKERRVAMTRTGTQTVEVDRTRELLQEALGDRDISSLKASELKELLIQALANNTNEGDAQDDSSDGANDGGL